MSRPAHATHRLGVTLLLGVALVAGCRDAGPVAAPAPPSAPLTRPLATSPAPAASPVASSPVASSPAVVRVFPVRSKAARFGRFHHDYPAADIFAPCGTAAVAPVDGRVLEVTLKDTWSARHDDGAARGGLSYALEGVDGVRYYGSHLTSVAAVPGRRVRAGDVLGRVGHTGSAQPTPCHLHFGLSPACGTGDWWNRRGVLSPHPYLTSWRKGGQRSPVRAVAAWRSKHGCPKAP